MNNYTVKKYAFGITSLKRLSTCDPRLSAVLLLAIDRSPIDFGIAEGHRSLERQKELFDEGKSKVDGVTRKGKHNYTPSQAVDVYAFINGRASWEGSSLLFIAGVIFSCASELGLRLRWGGNWDQDGEIVTDQKFQDFPHFEILD